MAGVSCHYCDRPAIYLCDFIADARAGARQTCDRPLCEAHRVPRGVTFASGKGGWQDTIDVCPGHAPAAAAGLEGTKR
jgi:hypothetical protein